MDNPNELMHFGVKGMRWGVRKDRSSKGSKGKKKKTKFKVSIRSPITREPAQSKPSASKEESKPAVVISRPKTVSEMSDEELSRFIRRVQLEKQYAQLTAPQKSKGKQFVEDVLFNSAKAVATQYTTQAMKATIDKALKQQQKKKPNQNGSGKGDS